MLKTIMVMTIMATAGLVLTQSVQAPVGWTYRDVPINYVDAIAAI